MTEEVEVYCTYARYTGIWWLYGWFWIGMRGRPEFGYSSDYCTLMLVPWKKSYGSVPMWFWFKPRKVSSYQIMKCNRK